MAKAHAPEDEAPSPQGGTGEAGDVWMLSGLSEAGNVEETTRNHNEMLKFVQREMIGYDDMQLYDAIS